MREAVERENETLKLANGSLIGLARYGRKGGLPVLAFHGAPAARVMFDVADEPARKLGLELICPDRPGYGLSKPDCNPTLASRTAMHLELIEALGLRRFHLLGVSGGCPYAVALAAVIPDRIKGLGLVSPIGPVADLATTDGPSVHPFHRWFFLRLPHRKRLLALNSGLSARIFKRAPQFFSRVFARSLSASDKTVLAQPHVEKSLIRMTQESLRQGVSAANVDLLIYSAPWGVQFGDVMCPAVVWQGTADRIVPPSISLALADRLPNCEAIRLAGQGHFWIYDNIGEVLSRLTSLDGSGL